MANRRAFNLSDLMADLQDDGVRDSTGVFTLDPKAAEQKLQNFSLARPQDYVLKLVQAAVANGASFIDLEARTGVVKVEWDGPPLRREVLPGLMGHLLSANCPPETRHLRHLAAGLRGSVAVEPMGLCVESVGFRRSWSQGAWKEELLPDLQKASTVVRLERDLGSIFRQWGSEIGALVRGTDNQNEEEEAVLSACGFLPLALTVNGLTQMRKPFGKPRFPNYRIVDDEFPGECRPPKFAVASEPESYIEGKLHKGHHLVERQVLDQTGSLPLLGERHASIRLAETSNAVRCSAWIAIEAALSHTSRVEFIDDGVRVFQEELELGIPGIVAVVSSEGLSKDLTGFAIVKDRTYQEKMEWVKGQAAELRAELLQRLEDIPIRDTVVRKFQG